VIHCSIRSTDVLLTLDEFVERSFFPSITAREIHFAKQVGYLPDALNRCDRRLVEQQATSWTEDELGETSEKSGETPLAGKTCPQGWSYLALVKTFFEVLSKVR
jgi:hypothetical protein